MQPPDVFYKKKTPTQMFSGEYCEIYENAYFEERLRMAGMGPSTERFSTTANAML